MDICKKKSHGISSCTRLTSFHSIHVDYIGWMSCFMETTSFFCNQTLTLCFHILIFFFFFNGMFTVSLLFRNILFCLENFHCLKNVSQSKDKKRVIGGYHKAWSMTKCLLHCSSTVINMNGYFAFRQVKIEKKINIIYFDNVAKTGCYPSCIGTF